MPPVLVHDPGTGDRFGDWIVDDRLGTGGMGSVHACHNQLSPRIRGALKVVAVSDASVRDRFVREVDSLAALRHSSLVRLLTCGEDHERRLLYLVMERITGMNLGELLLRGPLEWPVAVRVFHQLADGLRHAHGRGIAHRDVKPTNIMVSEDGVAVLVDFGVAFDQERSRLTQVGSVPGTVEYLAPELLHTAGAVVADEIAGDAYSLGVVFYETLTGERAFELERGGDGLMRMLDDKLSRGALDPGPLVPESLRTLVADCTAPHPLARPRMASVVALLGKMLHTIQTTEPAPDEEQTEVEDLLESRAETTFVGECDTSLWEIIQRHVDRERETPLLPPENLEPPAGQLEADEEVTDVSTTPTPAPSQRVRTNDPPPRHDRPGFTPLPLPTESGDYEETEPSRHDLGLETSDVAVLVAQIEELSQDHNRLKSQQTSLLAVLGLVIALLFAVSAVLSMWIT